MHKIWQGANPREILAGLGFFLGVLALVIHVFAFNVIGYPTTTKAKYNPPAVASALR
jgi:hypothetical protein